MEKRGKTKYLIVIALMVALICVVGFIRIPIGGVLDITFQSMVACLAGLLLGSKGGAAAQAVYLLLGLIGVPIFTQGGGIGYVLKPSFGYLLGFILCAFVSGLFMRREGKTSRLRIVLAMLAGTLCIYLVGVPYQFVIMKFVMQLSTQVISLQLLGTFLFFAGDAICLAVLFFLPINYFRRFIYA